MSDFFFQITLAIISIVIGVSVPLLPNDHQKKIAKFFAVLTIAIALLWAGYEWGVRQARNSGQAAETPFSTSQPSFQPTNTLPPTENVQVQPTTLPTIQLSATSIGHRQVPNLGSSDLVLTTNQVAIGTADRFQNVVNVSNPPFTIFVVYGEINTQLSMYWGGWDLWENASESFVESQILLKIDEVKGSHASDYATRGYRVIKCYGQVENCETILTYP